MPRTVNPSIKINIFELNAVILKRGQFYCIDSTHGGIKGYFHTMTESKCDFNLDAMKELFLIRFRIFALIVKLMPHLVRTEIPTCTLKCNSMLQTDIHSVYIVIHNLKPFWCLYATCARINGRLKKRNLNMFLFLWYM